MNSKLTNKEKARYQVMDDFLADLASDSPAPGGGSAAAVVGALAAALSSMVANLTIGKSGYQNVTDKYTALLSKTEEIREEFLEAIAEDMDAYNKVMDAYRMSTESKKEKEERKSKLQQALKGATGPPMKMAELAKDVLDISRKCAKTGNKHAVTDAGASAILAEATTRTALLNVDINLGSIHDEEFVNRLSEKRNTLEKEAVQSASKTVEIMQEEL